MQATPMRRESDYETPAADFAKALLVWVLMIGLGALGSEAVKRADELSK